MLSRRRAGGEELGSQQGVEERVACGVSGGQGAIQAEKRKSTARRAGKLTPARRTGSRACRIALAQQAKGLCYVADRGFPGRRSSYSQATAEALVRC
jgi:hypothetical protein